MTLLDLPVDSWQVDRSKNAISFAVILPDLTMCSAALTAAADVLQGKKLLEKH